MTVPSLVGANAVLACTPPADPAVRAALSTIPGVRVRDAVVLIPHHAIPSVDAAYRGQGVTARGITWLKAPPAEIPWAQVEARLRASEFRSSYIEEDYFLAYQKAGIAFAAPRNGALMHWPTGSGKTLAAIAWALLAPGAVVVVTKASTVVQFCRQAERYSTVAAFPFRAAAHVRKRDRWASLEDYMAWTRERGARPFVVMGYENIAAFGPKVAVAVQPRAVVVDESHLLKSWKRWEVVDLPEDAQLRASLMERAKRAGGFVKQDDDPDEPPKVVFPAANRTTAALRLARGAERRLLTTATPIKDRVRDLYAQVTLCEPDAWGSWTAWSTRYCDPQPVRYNARARDTRGLSNATELVGRLRSLVHTVPAAVVREHLPGMRRETLYVGRDQMVKLKDAEAKRFGREAAKAQKVGKAALVEVRIAEAAARCRKAILDRLEDHIDSGQKCVIFTVRKWLAKALEGHVRGRLRKRALVLRGTGDDSQKDRQALLDEYIKHDGPAVLIGTGHAWGTSVDGLQVTEAAFFLGHPYDPGELEQWEGRFPRLGQPAPVTLYYVVGEGTVLEAIAGIVIDKLPAIAQVATSGALQGAASVLGGTADPDALADTIFAKLDSIFDDTAEEL